MHMTSSFTLTIEFHLMLGFKVAQDKNSTVWTLKTVLSLEMYRCIFMKINVNNENLCKTKRE